MAPSQAPAGRWSNLMTMIPTTWAVYLISSLGMYSALIQATAPVTGSDPSVFIEKLDKLGLTGLLAFAVIVLWRKLQEKDKLLVENYKIMSDALAANKLTVEKMSDTLEGIKTAVEKLETVREQIRHRD